MLLGFSHLYEKAARSRPGYLSEGELNEACRILVPGALRANHAAIDVLRASTGLLILLGIVFAAWAISTLSSYWQLHQTVAQQQERLQRQIPMRFGDFRTLVAARAGITRLTRVFRLAVPPEDPMTADQLADFEVIVRTDVCATEVENIRRGISYANEYRDMRDKFIARFEFSSCP
jgi:hypothetical protein